MTINPLSPLDRGRLILRGPQDDKQAAAKRCRPITSGGSPLFADAELAEDFIEQVFFEGFAEYDSQVVHGEGDVYSDEFFGKPTTQTINSVVQGMSRLVQVVAVAFAGDDERLANAFSAGCFLVDGFFERAESVQRFSGEGERLSPARNVSSCCDCQEEGRSDLLSTTSLGF